MKFPLTKEPGLVALVDDMANFLESMVFALPEDMPIVLFQSALPFMEKVQQDMVAKAKRNAALRAAMERSQSQNISPLVEALRYWNAERTRFDYIEVAVMDNYMDQITGLDALASLKEWDGKRILLAGGTSENQVIKAFNEGVINNFFSKNNRELRKEIRGAIADMLHLYQVESMNELTPWGSTHTPKSRTIFKHAEMAEKLAALLGDECEYISTGEPLGVLALGYEGSLRYVCLTEQSELQTMAGHAQEQGRPADEVNAIAEGRMLSNKVLFESLQDPLAIEPVLFSVEYPQLGTTVHVTCFDVKTPFAPAKESCFGVWRDEVRSKLPQI